MDFQEGYDRVVKALGSEAEGSEFKPATVTKFLGSFLMAGV